MKGSDPQITPMTQITKPETAAVAVAVALLPFVALGF
jgi:hypothetical protein